jgi:glycosyltransferase involved in cell wall biosynthesis
MPPSISVIITCYNLEQYIAEAVESALEQQGAGTNVEVIVVDDASTDSSVSIVERIQGARLVRMERNGGVMLAMLRGIQESTGDIIFFLDGDDLWERDKLAESVRLFDDRKVVLATHDLTYVDARGEPIDRESRVAARLAAVQPSGWDDCIRQGILLHDDYVWLGSAFGVRRSLARLDDFAEFVRSLPDSGSVYQDWPLAYWCASLPGGHKLAFSPKKLFRYRLHQGNHSGDTRTVDRAARNYHRAAATLDAMNRIAEMRGLGIEIGARLKERAKLYRWQSGLYRKESSLLSYLRILPLLVREGLLLRETARFLGTSLLGPANFTRLAGGIR